MSTENLTLDLLAYHAFPRLATALRSCTDDIIQKWDSAVRHTLPAADKLTRQQLRDSLPAILQDIIEAFASDEPRVTRELIKASRSHGVTRFHESYNVQELIVEYRLLRRIVIEEVTEALDGELDVDSAVALNMAIDTALQSGLVSFTEHLQQQIKASTEAQSQYLSFLSHDLRNHLNRAVLHLELLTLRLAQAPEHSDNVENIQSIKRAIIQTTAGMDRLLQAEQLRQGSVQLNVHPVNLNFLLSEVTKQLSDEAKSKGLELRMDVPGEAQPKGDEGLLTLVLQNLLDNAVKYSSRGTVTIAARNISDGKNGAWVLSISDQGPGIAPKQLRHVFDAFRRGDTYGTPGVGLGLSIASQAAKLLGGRIEIESEVDIGSTFRLVLPQ